MSEQEKNRYIGEIVAEYSQAKIHLACLELKMESIIAGYKAAAEFLGRRDGFRIEGGKLHLGHGPKSGDHQLLGRAELLDFLGEVRDAQNRVERLRDRIQGLGLTNIE